MSKVEDAFCVVCAFFGKILPWALLVSAGIVSMMTDANGWQTASAAMIVLALILFLVSATLTRIVRGWHHHA